MLSFIIKQNKMIKYKLKCKNCSETFDSWFASSKEFEKLKKLKLISCNSCNSLKIDKSIMSPRISPRMNNINEKILEGDQGIWDLIAEKELEQMEVSDESWEILETNKIK